MKRFVSSVTVILGVSALCFGRSPAVTEFLRDQMHWSQKQIAGSQNGKAIAKILPTPNPSDIFVFGAVVIHAEPVAYLHSMRDVAGGALNSIRQNLQNTNETVAGKR